MGFSSDIGYTPETFDDIMSDLMEGVNEEFGTTYTNETFVGSGWYKFFYRAAQRMQKNEIRASEIFLKLQNYIRFTNEKILDPKVTANGLISVLKGKGYIASVKPMEVGDAGKIHVCVDISEDDPAFEAKKLEICETLRDHVVGGIVNVGSESLELTITNGQLFEFSFNLPDETEVYLQLTITVSRNNQSVIESPDNVKLKLLSNIEARYSLGLDFEPERYFTPVDAPWAGDILLEYSVDEGENWSDETYEANYDEIFRVKLENIAVIEA